MPALQSVHPSPLSKYELERLDRIAANRKRMEELGVLETARNLMATIDAAKPKPRPRLMVNPFKPRGMNRRLHQVRRSGRLSGKPALDYAGMESAGMESAVMERARIDEGDGEEGPSPAEYSDYDPEADLDDLLAGDDDVGSWEPARQEQFQELRCTSAGRGSMYDSHVGITCHFCRQKKLCGEDGCPRCSRRVVSAECIGKTECSRCHGGSGRFCRACLQIRYGQTIEEAREQMAAGTWLCPHCYEDEHPEEGWMCNSSICMKRRGFKPTGIAIYDAQQRGYASVAHWLQAQLKKRGGAAAVAAAGGSLEDAAAAAGGDASRLTSESAAEPRPAAPRRSARVVGMAAVAGAGAEQQEAGAAEPATDAPACSNSGDQSGGKRRSRAPAKGSRAAKAQAACAAEGLDAAGKVAAGKGGKGSAGGEAAAAAPASSREGSCEPCAPLTPTKQPGDEASAGAKCEGRPLQRRRL